MASAALEGREGGYLPARRQPALLPPLPLPAGDDGRRWARVLLCALAVCAGLAIAPLFSGDPPVLAAALALVGGGCLCLGLTRGASLRRRLELEVEDRTHELWQALAELEVAHAETVRKLSLAVELRDEATGAHIERIGRLASLLAQRLGMDERYCAAIFHAAPLHDVGKVAIPDAVLLKPGPLSAEERAIVQSHAEEGYRLLSRSSSSILEMAARIALTHHERWDGSGYPRGLRGEEIPLEGRIVAVCDVFDALTSDRVYRPAYPLEEAVALMRAQRARQFDPTVLDAFLGMVGAAARPGEGGPPLAALAEVLAKALENGDAELAEGAISQAIEEGASAQTLHRALLGPAIRRIYALRASGELSGEGEERAQAIARRLLATVFRSFAGDVAQRREPVLIAAVEGERRTVELQIAHDQLVGAGFRVAIAADLAPERLGSTVAAHRPRLVFVATSTPSLAQQAVELCELLVAGWPQLPVLVGGYAARAVEGRELPVVTVDPIERCVDAVESLLRGAIETASEPLPR